eukprot:5054027-Pleurochrysis_carterae.AAC.1
MPPAQQSACPQPGRRRCGLAGPSCWPRRRLPRQFDQGKKHIGRQEGMAAAAADSRQGLRGGEVD